MPRRARKLRLLGGGNYRTSIVDLLKLLELECVPAEI
jgi:hypothetical protein